jgi:non-ribosomal peptide synthetase component F
LEEEFAALYKGDTLPVMRLQYKDYSEWQNSRVQRERIRQQEAYWLKVYEGELPALDIPTDYPRTGAKRYDGRSVEFEILEEDAAALKKMALEKGTTLYILLLAIYNIFLSQVCGQADIVVGTSVAGRSHADLEKIIGMFVNTLALRNFPKGEQTFSAFIDEVKERILDAFDNQDYQFENLVEKVVKDPDMKRNPLFDVRFNFHSIEPSGKVMPEVKPNANVPAYVNPTAKFDMTLTAVEAGKKLYFGLEYSTQLFKKETIKRFVDDFKGIVSTIVKNKDIRLRDITIAHDFVMVESKVSQRDLDF